jgi:hypothetical protein
MMKKYAIGLTISFLALAIVIVVVFASGSYQSIFQAGRSSSESPAVPDSVDLPVGGRSGKVVINFRNFEYGKEWNANFEIINETTQPIFYIGSPRKGAFDYCTLGVRHEEPFPANHDGKIDNLTFRVSYGCYYGTSMALQTLNPGESIVLAADDHRVRDMLGIKEPNKETTAQIGFEVFVGEDKRREILWSEEITFPADPSRS